MRVLITGFDPFGGEKINPSYEAVKKLEDKIGEAQVIKVELPTVFSKAIEVLKGHIEKEQPNVVICVGQAGGRYDISIERVAINLDDARIKDNEGNQPIDEKIYKDGENAYFSSLPIKAMVMNIKENNIPASISNTAGTFVCNHIMYGLLYLIEKEYNHIRGGFIHVPFIPEQIVDKKNTPCLPLETISKGLYHAIEAIIHNEEDIVAIGGAIC